MEFRVGIHLGDVMVEEGQVYGDGVNIAARLERLAAPGGVCISETVHEQVAHKLDLDCHYLGERLLKNVAKPVRAYGIQMDERSTGSLRAASSHSCSVGRRRSFQRAKASAS